jgi:AcrR family transcriptional regulator
MPRRHDSVRRPTQARAVRRREEILDATARVLDKDGWDSLTTNGVAREAGTSIGTVYEYFSSREALLAGLLERHEQHLRDAIEAAFARAGGDPFAAADAVVDAFVSVWRSEPGYRAAWSASQTGGLLGRTGDRWAAGFTRRVGTVLRGFFPSAASTTATATARTAVYLVSGLLLAAMSGPARHERRLVAETKRALRAYIAAAMTSS